MKDAGGGHPAAATLSLSPDSLLELVTTYCLAFFLSLSLSFFYYCIVQQQQQQQQQQTSYKKKTMMMTAPSDIDISPFLFLLLLILLLSLSDTVSPMCYFNSRGLIIIICSTYD